MAHETYDPATEACSPEYVAEKGCGVGPGGNTTLIENNEKGIQENMVRAAIRDGYVTAPRTLETGNRVGVYGSKY